jgi:predicted alpha-1,2-mannosidase
MRRGHRSRGLLLAVYVSVAAAAAGGLIAAPVASAGAEAASAAASAAAPPLVTDPASLVNPMIGTAGGVNEFPGPDAPFGMMQWSPDTYPDRADGGGYTYSNTQISGYSLTHLSGPGCSAYGDVPILPTVGAVGGDPDGATDTFSHSTETAQAGYYEDTLGNGVTAQLTDTTRAGIGTFTFPATTQANLLLKLDGSADYVDSTQDQVIGDNEVQGSVTAGHFCGSPEPWENDYTLHFDIVFSQPFTASGTWSGTSDTGATIPGGVYLTFDTTTDQTVTARVGISFTSDANAAANLKAEIPSWDFAAVRSANYSAWNRILGRIQVAGGSAQQQTEFYTALYHALLYPSVFSDVNGQYTGFDGKTHTVAPGHTEYANFSGWDIYRSQVQLAAMVAPQQTSDAVTSMLNDYAQTGLLPKWNLGDGETFDQVGDPADPIIADAYAFGARGFDVRQALAAMIAEATTTNDDRPGQGLLDQDGYLPYDGSYGCCNFYGPVSTQLEYDTADYAIASLAEAIGDHADYETFAGRAQNWEHVFNAETGYVQARVTNGAWLGDYSPSTLSGFVEGTSAQYTPMVPFSLKTLIRARGGDAAWISYLNSLLSNLTNPGPANADLSDEPSLEIPWEYDYAGAPYLTQQVVREIEQELYSGTPAGEDGNDDLGTMSSVYVWDELGFYPEAPGTSVLALGSPAFPLTVVHLAGGRTLTISAPAAQPGAPYVHALSVNGRPWNRAYVDYASLSRGATLDYDLATTPDTTWAAAPDAAPPSDNLGGQPALTSAGPASGLILAPGASGAASFTVANLTGHPMTVDWTASPADGLTVSQPAGSLTVPAGARATASLTVTSGAGTADGTYPVTFTASAAAGARKIGALESSAVDVDVAKTGELWPYYTNVGISSDGQAVSSGYDGSDYTYSANALAADGFTPGATITSGGVTYTWPSAAPGELDSIESAGQVIPVAFPAGTTTIGLLGSAIDTGSGGAGGTLTVTYTDGTTQQVPVTFSDWTLGAGAYKPAPGDTIVATTPYRNRTSGISQAVPTYVYATSAALQAGKTVASVTLPVASGGDIGVFAIGAG